VSTVLFSEHLGQLIVVGQIAVMTQTDAVWRIYIERLRFSGSRPPRRRIAYVTNTDIAREAQHVPVTKHITHQTIALALPQAVLAPGYDARGILAAMLQDSQCVVNTLIDGLMTNNSD
jgi:hypothetical protein